jgi:hypothetical protein
MARTNKKTPKQIPAKLEFSDGIRRTKVRRTVKHQHKATKRQRTRSVQKRTAIDE